MDAFVVCYRLHYSVFRLSDARPLSLGLLGVMEMNCRTVDAVFPAACTQHTNPGNARHPRAPTGCATIRRLRSTRMVICCV